MAIVTSRCHITVCWEAADVSPVIMQVGRASVIRMWLGPPRKEGTESIPGGRGAVGVGLDILGRE